MEIEKLFSNQEKLRLPGFSIQESKVDLITVFPPGGKGIDEWYREFQDRFFESLNNKNNLPIFRSGHGEFNFILGPEEIRTKGIKRMRERIGRIYRSILFQSTFYSGSRGYGYEFYREWKLPRLRENFKKYLKWISENGVHAIYLSDRDSTTFKRQKDYLNWLQSNGIRITNNNLSHIYFIYALFNGLNWEKIFKNRKILIITSYTKKKSKGVKENLKGIGANHVEFGSVSRSHALEDKVHLDISFRPDLIIVGAGVGSANVIYQLRSYDCPVVDAGFMVDIFSDLNYKRRRLYCVNDQEWENFFGNDIPDYAKNFSKDKIVKE